MRSVWPTTHSPIIPWTVFGRTAGPLQQEAYPSQLLLLCVAWECSACSATLGAGEGAPLKKAIADEVVRREAKGKRTASLTASPLFAEFIPPTLHINSQPTRLAE